MRWLRRDEGVVLVLVGVLLIVLLGLAGMAIDVGALYAERRQLRNGADAAALAIAEDCGLHAKPCDQATAEATAQLYADANSRDGAFVEQAVDWDPPGCPTPTCVRVVTSAEVTVPLMSLFGLDPVTVTAAATAIFDHPLSGDGLALVVGTSQYHGGGAEIRLYPEGWLRARPDVLGSECWATVTAWAGNRGDSEFRCSQQHLRDYVYGQDVLIPLSDQWDPHEGEWLIAGFAYFHVTGYDFGPGRTYPPGFSCDPPNPEDPWQPCLRGSFTPNRTTIYAGTPGGPDYGLVLVKLVE